MTWINDDRRVPAAMWLASVSLSPWHDRTQFELREAREYDGTRVEAIEVKWQRNTG